MNILLIRQTTNATITNMITALRNMPQRIATSTWSAAAIGPEDGLDLREVDAAERHSRSAA